MKHPNLHKYLVMPILMSLVSTTVLSCNDTNTDSSVITSSTTDTTADPITTTDSKSTAPTGLTARIARDSLSLSWSPISTAQSYRLYWSYSDNVNQQSNFIDSIDTQYTHESLIENTHYYYRVSAWVNGEESILSNTYNAQTSNNLPVSIPSDN